MIIPLDFLQDKNHPWNFIELSQQVKDVFGTQPVQDIFRDRDRQEITYVRHQFLPGPVGTVVIDSRMDRYPAKPTCKIFGNILLQAGEDFDKHIIDHFTGLLAVGNESQGN
jgi:hypothetical protein